MGEIVPAGAGTGALVEAKAFDPAHEVQEYEKRLKEAQVLEEKLRRINEDVPTRIFNVMGSCAGAGSGDFHHYRQVRRAEQDRLKKMDEEYDREQRQKEHEEKLKELQQRAEERTSKRRAKRQKKKERKKVKLAPGVGADDKAPATADTAEDEDSADELEQAPLD